MMYKHVFASCLIIVSTLACANDDSDATQSAVDSAQTNEVLRRNADGELILRRAIVEPAAFREVEVGQTCGKKDENGIELVCQPNARCISTSDSSPGMCVASPRPKKTN